MAVTEADFRALARSSPWRWRTLHFTYAAADDQVEAWVRRPGQLLVRARGRKDFRVDERGELGRHAAFLSAVRPSAWGRSAFQRTGGRRAVWPHEAAPVRREDGLVLVRPPEPDVEYGDPMYQSYDWVAMLDPVELSHHTTTTDVHEADRLGRRTWWARVQPQEGYDPTCGCCPLLWSFVSDRDEYADEDERHTWRPPAGTFYPEAYDVALDVQTAVAVERTPVGRSSLPIWHRLEILEVDAELGRLFPGP